MRTGWRVRTNLNASGSGRSNRLPQCVGVLGSVRLKKFMTNMKGIFWNSRGLKDLDKRRFLAEASIEHRLDFIALLETGRDNFSPQFLNILSGGIDFDWHCLPPRGRLGGILLGVRCDSLEVRSVVMRDFAVKFWVRSKADGFK